MTGSKLKGYGPTTISAYNYLVNNTGMDPRQAWLKAIEVNKKPEEIKGCPLSAFLTLCSEGLLIGIPEGDYAKRIRQNYCHTMAAITSIEFENIDFNNYTDVWRRLDLGTPNNQGHIDVIHAVYKHGKLNMAKLKNIQDYLMRAKRLCLCFVSKT